MSNLHSYEIEKQFLSSLIKHPDAFGEVSEFINTNDFYSEDTILHKTIFSVVKSALDNKDSVDPVILSERISQLGISFEDNLNVGDYINSLSLRPTTDKTVVSSAKELKKYSAKREVYEAARSVAIKIKKLSPDATYAEILETADQTFNEKISRLDNGDEAPENIYDELEAFIEGVPNKPQDVGLLGPHEKINQIYGSLLKPANITVLVARPAVGKTTFCLDYATKVADRYGIPIIHFDNGEMTKQEIMFRQCAALADVPHYMVESGEWVKSEELTKKVRSLWPIVKKMELYYCNVGGKSVDEMVSILKRFYFNKVGRGNKAIFSFDYIKTTFQPFGNKQEWQIVGEMLDKFKYTIKEDIKVDGKPILPMLTSIQMNRLGISRGRDGNSVADDESVVSLSDRVQQFCSHMFILREKTHDELLNDGNTFGTHKLIRIKARHLGEDWEGDRRWVQVGDQLKQNFINFDFNNFAVEERGDLRDIVRSNEINETIEQTNGGNIPDFEQFAD